MQVLFQLKATSISLPSSYSNSNVGNCNLCYQFYLIFTYGLSTHNNNNNIRKITLCLIKGGSPRFGHAIWDLPSD